VARAVHARGVATPRPPVATGKRAIRVLLADDHPLILDGVRNALARADDIAIVGAASSGREALLLARRTAPDVVLLDLRMPEMAGFECLRELRRISPRTRVIVLTASSEPREIRTALRLGAAAFVVKSVRASDLASVIRQTVQGTTFTTLDDGDGDECGPGEDLTPRELTILRAVASGLSNQEIGRTLWVSEQTIKFHLRNVYRKLGISNRIEAARYAHEAGLIE
jgi:DNA-binding NarL/FixJ family response regulator